MKRNSIKKEMFFGTLVLFSIASMTAQGDRERSKKPPTFEQLLKDMDADKDGKLSKKEIKGPLKKNFNKVDLNEDGFITEEEFKKAPKPKREGRQRN